MLWLPQEETYVGWEMRDCWCTVPIYQNLYQLLFFVLCSIYLVQVLRVILKLGRRAGTVSRILDRMVAFLGDRNRAGWSDAARRIPRRAPEGIIGEVPAGEFTRGEVERWAAEVSTAFEYRMGLARVQLRGLGTLAVLMASLSAWALVMSLMDISRTISGAKAVGTAAVAGGVAEGMAYVATAMITAVVMFVGARVLGTQVARRKNSWNQFMARVRYFLEHL